MQTKALSATLAQHAASRVGAFAAVMDGTWRERCRDDESKREMDVLSEKGLLGSLNYFP